MDRNKNFKVIILLILATTQISKATAKPLQSFTQQPGAVTQTVDSKRAKLILSKQPQAILLDVRTPEEYAAGHLKNALNLNYNATDFATHLSKLDKNKPYLVYCAMGGRSSEAAKLMQDLGFRQVINVSEGYISLKKAGIPVGD